MRRTMIPALLMALAGCGGGSGSGSLEPSTPTTVGEAVGCTVKPYHSGEMFVKEAGECQIDGQKVTIYTFGDAEGRDGWLDVATKFGAPGEAESSRGDRQQLVTDELGTSVIDLLGLVRLP